jgi:hypothetical protein
MRCRLGTVNRRVESPHARGYYRIALPWRAAVGRRRWGAVAVIILALPFSVHAFVPGRVSTLGRRRTEAPAHGTPRLTFACPSEK